jgi:methyltransferase (TIGR00027 family)
MYFGSDRGGRFMDADKPLEGVGGTALGVARVRAWESRRPDRLFDDPYAELFVEAGDPPEMSGGHPGVRMVVHATIRTRFYDEYLLGAGCRQVVLLAAGLDTRAYRLNWPDGVRLFEVDLPEVLSFKESRLMGVTPRCERIALPADLRTDWSGPLVETGFDPSTPTAWLAEGLLIYLDAEEAAGLLTAIGDLSAPGSRVSFERGDPAARAAAATSPAMDGYTSLWKGGLAEDPVVWLSRNGWRTESHNLADLAAEYDRPITSASTSGFLTATYTG